MKITLFDHIIGRFTPTIRNYPTDSRVDECFKKIMSEEPIKYTRDPFNHIVETKNFILNFWDENRYYAWLNQGSFKNKNNNRVYAWRGAMPSRLTSWVFRRYVKKADKIDMDILFEEG